MTESKKKEGAGIFFENIDKFGRPIHYPAWRYHPLYEPRVVNNTEEDQLAADEGWKSPNIPTTAVQTWNNFYHDLEDMNPKQLAMYARDEYGADLPPEAGKAKLLRAIWILAMHSPKTKDRIVLLAQSIRMNLDETQAEIMKMAGDLEKCDEVTREEIWL